MGNILVNNRRSISYKLNYSILVLAILAPNVPIAFNMRMNQAIFPYRYSVFGDLERTHFPNEQPLFEEGDTTGQIRSIRIKIPLVSYYVFRSGLGISIFAIGKVFIPFEKMVNFRDNGDGSPSSDQSFEINHHSEEVNNPIYLPDKELFEEVMKAYHNRKPNEK